MPIEGVRAASFWVDMSYCQERAPPDLDGPVTLDSDGQPRPNPRFELDADGIGWITFDDPARALNVLTEPVMEALAGALGLARIAGREGRARCIVFRSGKDDSFVAGADVDAIAELEDPGVAEAKVRRGQGVFSAVASLPVPTVAAVHGICLGGGLELALACTRRIASDSSRTRFGLPEVMLGILPAWGGTTRLPRVVGLQAALDLLLTGKRIDGRKALRIGLVDALVPAELFAAEVRRFAGEVAGGGGRSVPGRSAMTRWLDDTALGRRLVLRMARRKVMAETGGHYPAPLRILDVLGEHAGGTVEAGLAAEARAAAELIVSEASKNLIHVFRLREAARKAPIQAADSGAEEVTLLGVLGAGVMGGGIAQLAAYNGIAAHMKDIRHEAVVGGLRHARGLFDKAVERRKMTAREARRGMGRISGGIVYKGLSGAQVVVEAVVERMDVKRQVLAETERHVRADCLLATNTSSLSVAEMAGALARPERFLGMHFFNPVHKMPLVEVVRGPRTADEAVAAIYRLALRLGKVPVIVADGPGFLVNRILGPYLNEGGFLLGDGATIGEIDRVATDFGLPMGPLRLIDEVGIDVSRHAGIALHEGLGSRLAPSPALEAMGMTERLGRKGGKGFYTYHKGRARGPDPTVYGELGLSREGLRTGNRPDDGEIRRRLVLSMVNEAARALEDGIVETAAAVDLALVMGIGFPPFRGGLLRCADTLHARSAVDALRTLESRHGPRFAPAPLLVRLAAEDRGFYDAFPAART